MRILLDMDCVLADFVGGVARRWGLTTDALLAHWEPGVYDVVPPLNRATGRSLTAGDFWADLDGSWSFWADLDPLPWAKELFDRVDRASGGDWWVVTVPSRCPECYKGKHRWCNRFFGLGASYFERLIPVPRGEAKALLANPGTLLIDDNRDNCLAFEDAGGKVLMFPAHHNPLYARAADPLGWVLPVLDAY